MPQVEVTRNEELERYEARLDGEVAGVAEFELTAHAIVFVHTEVDPAFEGRGVGSALAKGALDDALSRGDRRVKVVCPFLRAWVARHPEYASRLTVAADH